MKNNIAKTLVELKDFYFETREKINSIEDIASDFRNTNLKLYHASSYLYDLWQHDKLITEKQAHRFFEDICCVEYEQFQDWEHENLSYVKREYIGRTSSFYYGTNWEGNVITNYSVEQLLRGNGLNVIDTYGELDSNIYDYLVYGTSINDFFESEFEDEDEILDYLEMAFDEIDRINDDLDEIDSIVRECKLAYDYLREFKTEENEIAVVDGHLEFELQMYYAEYKAEELYDLIISKIDKLNTVKEIDFDFTKADNDRYMFNFSICEHEYHSHTFHTEMTTKHVFSEMFVKCITQELDSLLDENFLLKK